jgi:DNA repair exonuclease SbcCD ATPase subunit
LVYYIRVNGNGGHYGFLTVKSGRKIVFMDEIKMKNPFIFMIDNNRMKIRLQNIKCYTDSTFDFGEEGLALLSGQSGKGKSTIVQGIYFALFGVGNKITTSGKNTCKVDLEFDGMKITRSKNPGKLVVNEIYEGDAAQDMINQKFGATFDVTGYIPQNAIKSFVLMNPQDKLMFLERFAFDDIDLSEMKIRCKEQTAKKHDELIAATSKIEIATELAETSEEPEFVEFPIPVKKDDYERAIRNETIRLKNSNTFITRDTEIRTSLVNERHDLELYLSKLETSTNEIDDLEIALSNNDSKVIDVMTDEEVNNLNMELKSIIANRELISLNKQYVNDLGVFNDMVAEEGKSLNKELDELTTELWSEYTAEEIQESIESTEELLKDSERLEALKTRESKYKNDKSIDDIRTELEQKQGLLVRLQTQEGVHKCPSCSKSLRFTDSGLVVDGNVEICDETIDKDVLKNQITILDKLLKIRLDMSEITDSYEDEMPDSTEVKTDLDYLRQYEFVNTRNEKRKGVVESAIKNRDFSKSCKQFAVKLEETKQRVDKLKSRSSHTPTTDMTEVDIRSELEKDKSNRVLQRDALSRKREIVSKLESYKSSNERLKTSHLEKYNRISTTLDSEITKINLEITGHETKKLVHEENMKIIDRWKRMKEDMKKYNDLQSRVELLRKTETEKRNQYAALTTLRENIIEAESISMMNIVESINTHARVYLDEFFEDDPIIVNLLAFKQTKKVVKAQINMEIEYKGMECDLQMMSGGEMSRIILAYTLALAEMFNTPLLLLDECTASLDQETADHVFESIRDNFNGKLTLIVAHQVVTGTFDKTVSLDAN